MIFKRLIGIFAIIFALAAFSNVVFALPNPTQDFFVNDFAGVLSESDKTHIQDSAVDIYNKYDHTQIVVVTVNSLDGKSIEEYAHNIFNSWGIGDKDKNNGVLLLIVPDGERGARMRIEVGYGLESVLTDGTSGYILDNYVMPDYTQGDYSSAAKQGFDKIAETITGEFVVPEQSNVYALNDSDEQMFFDILFSLLPMLFGIGLLIAVQGIYRSYGKRRSADTPAAKRAVPNKDIIKNSQKRGWIWTILGSVILLPIALFLLKGFFLWLFTFAYILLANHMYQKNKYKCPECSAVMQYNIKVDVKRSLYNDGRERIFFHCPKCHKNYQDLVILPRKSDFIYSSGGSSSSGGGSSGGFSGGGGSSGGGGASR